MNNNECAEILINAIKTIANKSANLDNLESYLSNHFDKWIKQYANTPEGLANEMKAFAEMDGRI